MGSSSPITADNYFKLKNKLALVTGASSGLGWHFSKVLAAAGCTVAIAARREDKLQLLANDILELGQSVIKLPMDVTDSESIDDSLRRLADELHAPDILINNAGVAIAGRFLDTQEADLQKVLDVNQHGVWQVAQKVCQYMVKDKRMGVVINIASILGLDVSYGLSSYALSKAAVVQLTKSMALELARHNIRVNAIAPGYFNTEMNQQYLDSDAGKNMINKVPLQRSGELEELNGTLLLLSSSRSSFTTGSVFTVDGGHLVSGL